MAEFTLDYFLVILSTLIVMAIFLYFLYRKFLENQKNLKVPEDNPEGKWYDFFTPRIPERIRHLRFQRRHRVVDKQHHDFFTEFGLRAKKVDNRLFNKLRRMSKIKERRIFRNLEHLTEVVKKKERQVFHRKEIEGSISKLKKMFGKK